MNIFRKWYYNRLMRAAVFMLMRIDIHMRRSKWPNHKRKQFWNDFIRSPASRQIALNHILAEMRAKPERATSKKKLRRKDEQTTA